MSTALITGGSGLIGRRVLEELKSLGYEVHAVSRHAHDPGDDVVWHVADLLRSADVVDEVRPELLLHLAWEVEPGAFWTSPSNLPWIEASLDLLRQFARSGGRRAVVAGTCAEYDWEVGNLDALSESTTPIHPATVYGRAKNDLHERASQLLGEMGVDLAWCRVFSLYAPDEAPQRLFAAVARALLSGNPAKLTSGSQVRDYLHADDVGAAFAAVAASNAVGAVNIGSGIGISIRDFAQQIGLAIGRPELIQIGALPLPPGEESQIVADVSRLREEVSFAPRLTLSAGIEVAVAALEAEMNA